MSRLTASSMSAWVDGPNACRSASRMSRSSSGAKSKNTSGSSGATRWLTSATAIRPASSPTASSRYSKMQLYWPGSPAAAGLAVADVGAGEVLELEGDVLGDMAGPGPVAESRDEPAPTTERAGVILERRQQGDQRVVEVRQQVRRVLLEDAEVDEQADDRLARPVVGAAQDARLEDAQGRAPVPAPGFATARRDPCLERDADAVRATVSATGLLLAGWAVDPAGASWRRPRRPGVRAGSGSRRAGDGAGRSGSRPAANGARRR